MFARYSRWLVLFAFALFPFLLTGCGPSGPSVEEVARQWAPQVRETGLETFSRVDLNTNGELSESELQAASQSANFTEAERQVFAHMHEYRAWIGHVVDSVTVTTPVTTLWPMPDGNGGFYYIPMPDTQTTTTYIYAISKSDLETYKQRLEQKK